MKEWSTKFLVPVDKAKISNLDIIGSLLVTQFEHVRQTSAKKKKREEEVQNIETDEEDNVSEESRPGSPTGGGGDEVNQEVGGEEGEGEAALTKDPPTEAETSKKMKVSL
jgi:hypothetical protein